jgi:uncharacterized protein HemY
MENVSLAKEAQLSDLSNLELLDGAELAVDSGDFTKAQKLMNELVRRRDEARNELSSIEAITNQIESRWDGALEQERRS